MSVVICKTPPAELTDDQLEAEMEFLEVASKLATGACPPRVSEAEACDDRLSQVVHEWSYREAYKDANLHRMESSIGFEPCYYGD